MKTTYKFFVTIKINCGGTISRLSVPVGVYATSCEEAKKLLKTDTTFNIEEPIQLITEL